jgi:hypothetical protein
MDRAPDDPFYLQRKDREGFSKKRKRSPLGFQKDYRGELIHTLGVYPQGLTLPSPKSTRPKRPRWREIFSIGCPHLPWLVNTTEGVRTDAT